jgi:serine/threonine protein kinase
MLKANIKISEYTLIEKVGSGAFGDVWKAEKRTKRDVNYFALKFFRAKDDEVDLRKIQKEVDVWKKLRGLPHIISVFELDDFEDFIFVVSDFADGGSLEAWLKANGGKAESHEHAVKITIEILIGLENLHEKGVVHRDLKPDNILIMNGKHCLADFGVSREVKSHSKATGTAGTLEYMPPEAFNKNPSITAKTDIWAIGVILQRLLTSELPYPQDEQPSLIAAILYGEPEKVSNDIPQKLREIIEKCLQKEPNKRFKSAKELKESLEKFLRDVIKQRKTIEDEEFQKQQAEIEHQRLKAEVEEQRLRDEENERQRLAELKRIEQAEAERQRIIELKRIERQEAERQRIIELKRIERQEAERQRIIELKRTEQAEAERRRLIEIKRIANGDEANRLKKLAEEQKNKQAKTEKLPAVIHFDRQKDAEKFSFAEQLPPTKDWREIEREKDAEAKRRQADIEPVCNFFIKQFSVISSELHKF